MSVQDGLRFYDDQKATMPRILDYGGWCCFGESLPSICILQISHTLHVWVLSCLKCRSSKDLSETKLLFKLPGLKIWIPPRETKLSL